MKAVVLSEFGGSEKLEICEVPIADPSPNEAQVRVRAIGLNRAEVAARVGKYPLPKELPIRLGYEGAGDVVKVGARVSRVKVGDRVAVVPIRDDFAWRGTYAEYCNVPEELLAITPVNFSDIEAAATWMAFLTCWTGIIKEAGARRGDTLLVTAASSSLGLPALQLAQAEGMTVIATTRSSEKIPALRAQGFERIINTGVDNFPSAVRSMTNGHGIDIAFDCVGGPFMKEIASVMAQRGRIVSYGMLDSRPMELTPIRLMVKQITMIGHMVFATLDNRTALHEGVAYVERGIENGVFRPAVARIFPFSEIAAAHDFMQTNAQVGKVVVSIP